MLLFIYKQTKDAEKLKRKLEVMRENVTHYSAGYQSEVIEEENTKQIFLYIRSKAYLHCSELLHHMKNMWKTTNSVCAG